MPLHWAKHVGTGRSQGATGRSTPSVRCSGVGHVSLARLKTTVAANGYLALAPDTAPPDAQLVHTGRVRCTPDSCAESSANSHGHRTQATGCTLSVRCSPDSCAERVAKPPAHPTLSTGLTPVRPVHTCATVTTPDALDQRPVLPAPASGPATSPNFPPVQ